MTVRTLIGDDDTDRWTDGHGAYLNSYDRKESARHKGVMPVCIGPQK